MATYTVKSGDTLSKIAARYGLDWRQLASMNSMADPSKLRVGQTLNLSKAPAAPKAKAKAVAPKERQSFEKLLPYEKVFNKNLITGFAESQINPEIARQKYTSLRNLQGNLAASGMFRTGRGAQARTGLESDIERQRKEQVQGFTDTIGQYTTDWYNKQKTDYYNNPNAYKMPTLTSFEEFAQANPSMLQAYEKQTNIPTNYTNPFGF